MIVRIIIVLICVMFFINGCNSLISQLVGTHKLRTFEVEVAAKDGIGDSDYINIADAVLSEDFVYQPSKYPGEPGVIIYPVLTEEQARKKSDGAAVKPAMIAWTADFHAPCVDSNNCVTAGTQAITGVVRNLPKGQQEGMEKLEAKGYDLTGNVAVVNQGEAPVAWYWNGLIMFAAAAIAIGMEAYFANRKKHETAH
jgi:hypothetical protein